MSQLPIVSHHLVMYPSLQRVLSFTKESAYRTQNHGERLAGLATSFRYTACSTDQQDNLKQLAILGEYLQIKAQAVLGRVDIIDSNLDCVAAAPFALALMLEAMKLTFETRKVLLEANTLFLSDRLTIQNKQKHPCSQFNQQYPLDDDQGNHPDLQR